MPSISSHKERQKVRHLAFCYQCGGTFEQRPERTADHVPPRSVFADSDQVDPLILDAHGKCNGEQSADDQLIGQLVSLLHYRMPPVEHLKFEGGCVPVGAQGAPAGIVMEFDLQGIVWRWVRAFHAALYCEFLAADSGHSLHHPFPIGVGDPNRGECIPVHPHHHLIAQIVRANRAVGNLDSICCRNATCRYECVWCVDGLRKPTCVYALDLYGWDVLGDVNNHQRRGCVGRYVTDRLPAQSSVSNRVFVPVPALQPLDPFEALP